MCLPSKLAEDFNIWCKWKNKPMNLSTFIMFFLKFAEFRALVDYRLKYTLNPQLHSRSATYIKRNGLLIRKITIKSSRPFQCAYHPLTP